MSNSILELAFKKIEEEKKAIVENLADGVAKDYAAEGLIQQHPTAAVKIDPNDPHWEPHL